MNGRNESVQTAYDAQADVLYIALGEPRPAYSVEDGEIEGLHYRRSLSDGDLCGVTIVWCSRHDADKLVKKLRQIELPPHQMQTLGLEPGWQERVTLEIAEMVLAAAEKHAEALRELAKL